MEAAQGLRINGPTVIHETIDDEVIIINLAGGAYYSLEGSGADVWALLERGASEPGVVAALTAKYDGDPAEIERSVSELIAQLRLEELIVDDGTGAMSDEPLPLAASSLNGSRPPFTTAQLEKFTDVAELLLLDPIHDVDDIGWPHQKVETP